MLRLFPTLLPGLLLTLSLASFATDLDKISLMLDADDKRCAQDLCDYAQSESALAAALKQPMAPNDRIALLHYSAEVQRRKGQYAQSIEIGAAVLKLDPKHQRTHYSLGEVYAKQNQHSQAVEHFARAATGSDTDLSDMSACRASGSEMARGRIDRALKVMPRGHPARPWTGGCLQNLAVEADKLKHWRLAAPAYHQAAVAKTKDVDSWMRAMYLYAANGDQLNAGKVIVEFNRHKLNVPATYETMYLYAVTSVASPPDALRIVRAWYEQVNPKSLWLQERLATALVAANELREAEAMFRALVKTGGERKPAYIEGLSDALARQRKFADVAAMCQTEKVVVSQSTRLKLKCGEAYQVTGDCAQALSLLKDVLVKPDSVHMVATAALASGLCLERSGDHSAALAMYQRAPNDARIAPRLRIVQSKLSKK
jgi:tetratricopeptide (TPR) repeat protein